MTFGLPADCGSRNWCCHYHRRRFLYAVRGAGILALLRPRLTGLSALWSWAQTPDPNITGAHYRSDDRQLVVRLYLLSCLSFGSSAADRSFHKIPPGRPLAGERQLRSRWVVYLIAGSTTTVTVMAALAVYGFPSKTFYWPHHVGGCGRSFPAPGAKALPRCMGGMGMLAAGLLGGPGIGYCRGPSSCHKPAVYSEYAKAARLRSCLYTRQRDDGGKLGAVRNSPRGATHTRPKSGG